MLRLSNLSARHNLMRRRVSAQVEASSSSSTPVPPSEPSASQVRKPITLQGPEPRPFSIKSTDHLLAILPRSIGSAARLGTGLLAEGYSISLSSTIPEGSFARQVAGQYVVETSNPPSDKLKVPIQLYEFESCPYCKKVREACSILQLDMQMFPCPKGGTVYRPKVVEMGGKAQFPYMIDPNQDGVAMYESDDIIKYLFETYGSGQVPLMLRFGNLTTLSAAVMSLTTQGSGSPAKPSKNGRSFPLELWGYEVSPFVKLVRDVLSELEISYISRQLPRGSIKRQHLYDKHGEVCLPYIEDPNTGVGMFESTEIVRYLQETYGA